MSRLKITADTSPVKKSLLELSSEVKKIGGSGQKVSIFSESDRRFLKKELNQELSLMKKKLTENKGEITKLVKEAQKLEKGSKEELKVRKQINDAYKTQSRLGREIGQVQGARKNLGGIGGMGGSGGTGGIMGMLGKGLGAVGGLLGGGALALGGMGVMKAFQSAGQYKQGARNRVRMQGLGVTDDNFGSPEALANAGLTEQEAIQRRIDLTSKLGKNNVSNQDILQQASFERAQGLEEGQMSNVATSLRANFGGRGANDAQMKLQASVLASGIEDAIGPYLDAATGLLASINENGITGTNELINAMGQLTRDGERTPEQIAKAFAGVDSAVKGSSGEANAFFQTAFARQGIGGGTIGSTKLAMESGGIFGLDADELKKRGYNEELIKNMQGAGFTDGLGNRTEGIMNQFKASAGMGKNDRINDITDMNQMVGMSSMANSVFGTQGLQGFDALKMLEKVQSKEMTQTEFKDKLKEMKEGKNPQVERLDKINQSLAGQTTVLNDINTNLMENLGKTTIKADNALTEQTGNVIRGTDNLAGAIDDSGVAQKGYSKFKGGMDYVMGGGIGSDLYDWWNGSEEENLQKQGFKIDKKRNMPTDSQGKVESAPATEQAKQVETMAAAVEKGMTKAMAKQKTAAPGSPKVTIKQNINGKPVKESTHK